MNDVVIRQCDSGMYLLAVYLGRSRTFAPLLFISNPREALPFVNEEEAQATIDFISNVIDYETAECLEVVIVP